MRNHRTIKRCNAERLELAGYQRLLEAVFGEHMECRPFIIYESEITFEDAHRTTASLESKGFVIPDAILVWRWQNYIERNPSRWN